LNLFLRAALFGKFARDSSRLTRYRKCIDPITIPSVSFDFIFLFFFSFPVANPIPYSLLTLPECSAAVQLVPIKEENSDTIDRVDTS